MMQPNSSDNCAYRCKIQILNLFNLKLQLINTKPITKNKRKKLCKKRNDRKIFYSSATPNASDSEIEEVHRSIEHDKNIKFASKD